MSRHREWKGVPQIKWSEWSGIFDNSRDGINVSVRCPVCGSKTLHRYFIKGKPLDRYIGGEHFVAYGSSWEWCSTCYSYEHSQSLVPEWWKDELDLAGYQLTAEPEALELALSRKK